MEEDETTMTSFSERNYYRQQLETLLHEASMVYLRTGENREEIERYIQQLEELNREEVEDTLNINTTK